MTDHVAWIAALFAGGALGLFYFVSLRWAVGRALSSQHAALCFVGSMVLRTSVVLAGFYAVGQSHWERWGLCMLGFFLAKLLVVRMTAPASPVEHRDAPQS